MPNLNEFAVCNAVSFRLFDHSGALEHREPIDAEFLIKHLLWQPEEYKRSADKRTLFRGVAGFRSHGPTSEFDCGGVECCPTCYEYLFKVFEELREKAMR